MDPQSLMFILSLISTLQTNQSNRQLASDQRDWSETMMDKQNEYNTPGNQVQRLREAGISPSSLSMGNGMSVNGNVSAPVNQYQTPSMLDPFSIASNSLLSMSKANETNSLLEERKKNIEAQTMQYEAQAQKLGLESREQQIVNEYCSALNEAALMKSYSEIGLNYQNIAYLKSKEDEVKYNITNVLPAQIQESISRTNLNVLEQDKVVALIQQIYAETDLAKAETDLVKEQTNTEEVRQAQGMQDIANTQADTELKQTMTKDLNNTIRLFLDTYDDQVKLVASQGKLTSRQANLYYVKQASGLIVNAAVSAYGITKVAKAAKAKDLLKTQTSSTTW